MLDMIMSTSQKSPHASQQSLISSDRNGSDSLFDIAEEGSIPGNLHLTNDEAILRYIKRHGAVTVVRQLATDLAEREAEVGLLRKQKDDREREMKRLLVQEGISLSEIDRRLNAVSIRDPGEAIDQLVGEALQTELRPNDPQSESELVILQDDNKNNNHEETSSKTASVVSLVSESNTKDMDSVHDETTHRTSASADQNSVNHNNAASIPGPVELRDIVPHSTQPPTMSKSLGANSAKHITDRYGFIQQSNGRKKDKTPSSPDTGTENDPKSVDDDYDDDYGNGDKHLSSSASGGGQLLHDFAKATMAQATALTNKLTHNSTSKATDTRDVRQLLRELGHQHDEVQKIQDTKWGEFMRKIEDSMDPLCSQPVIGVVGTNLRGKAAREFKELIYMGIPVYYRPKVWGECSGAWSLKEPGTYDWLLAKECTTSMDDESSLKQIELDIHRTMPSNVYFGGTGPGVDKLRRVLLAYSRWNTETGYCQGMNMIAAMLLLSFASEEDAFWVLVSLIENILPHGYFAPPLMVVRADLKVFESLLKQNLPALFNHLEETQVQLDAITFDWFLSCFTDTLSPDVVFRLWDILLCVEGQAYLFKIALALFKINEAAIMCIESSSGVYSHMKTLHNQSIKVEALIKVASSFVIANNLDETREKYMQTLV